MSRQQQTALFVPKVDHVGVPVVDQTQQKRLVEALDNPSNERKPSMHPSRVVHVYQESAVDVDEQNAVLIVVGDAGYANAVRQLMPSSVFQHRDVASGRSEALVDASAQMVRQQDLLVEVVRLRICVQVVGVAVRDPHVLAVPHGLGLLRGDLVRKPPAAEVRIADDPRIRRQDRAPVVGNHGRVADRVETDVHQRNPSTRGEPPAARATKWVYDNSLAMALDLRHETRRGSAGDSRVRLRKNLPYVHAGETPALPVRRSLTKNLSYTPTKSKTRLRPAKALPRRTTPSQGGSRGRSPRSKKAGAHLSRKTHAGETPAFLGRLQEICRTPPALPS